MTELHLYDFDGTLFRSPDMPDWWDYYTNWLMSSVSLGPPCVPKKPGGDWWIGKSVAAAKQSIAEPGVWAIVCTGRAEKGEGHRYRIPELLKQAGLNFDEVYLNPGADTGAYKKKTILSLLRRFPQIDTVQIWEDHITHLGEFCKVVEGAGRTCIPHPVRSTKHPVVCTQDHVEQLAAEGWMELRSKVAAQWIGRLARRPTPESKQWKADLKARAKHVKDAVRAFKQLVKDLQPYADQAKAAFPDKDKLSIQRRGRQFMKVVKTLPAMTDYLDTWIGTNAQNPKAYSWRSAVMYQARNVLLVPDYTMRKAVGEVEKQADKGFQAIAISESQAPLREVLPDDLRAFLPQNVVVEVDKGGVITKVTDRFENEHLTLEKKIEKQRELLRRYNKIAKQVKADLKSNDEMTRLAALVTAIIMETGIRPGKAGNHVVKIVNGEDAEIETFGAITLGPKHVQFVKAFAKLEFVGKKGGVNTATLSDREVIALLKKYVEDARKGGSKYVFVTRRGQDFTYTDLQRYFRESGPLSGISPTDFRKLRATATVLERLHEEQQELYERIRGFAKGKKTGLKERIVAEVAATLQRAGEAAQEALSHESATTTVRAYINPEIVLRFLSQGRIEDTLEAAILQGQSTLSFDPQVFVEQAMSKRAYTYPKLTGLVKDVDDFLYKKYDFDTEHKVTRDGVIIYVIVQDHTDYKWGKAAPALRRKFPTVRHLPFQNHREYGAVWPLLAPGQTHLAACGRKPRLGNLQMVLNQLRDRMDDEGVPVPK